MNATQMSAKIRAKKKKMQEDESGAVKLSGIPEDAQEIDHTKRIEATDDLNENVPKERDEDPSLSEERSMETKTDPMMSETSPDPKQINQPEDGARESRKAKMRKAMAKASAK